MKKKSFVLHDETINTRWFKMRTAGCNLEEFIKNPVMLYNHNDYSLPVGRWENIRIEGTRILADPVFDDGDSVGREIARKVEHNFVRAASIGAWPPEEVTEETDLVTGASVPVVTKWTAREASIVTIGANHNALVFYDRATGNLMEEAEVLKMFDLAKPQPQPESTPHETNFKVDMKKLAEILKLADSATEADITAAVRQLQAANVRLTSEKGDLEVKLADHDKAARDAQKAEAVTLVDAAVANGRLDAKAKDNFLKLFDTDFDAAKASLEAIPQRQSVTKMIDENKGQSAVELADLEKMNWNQLDKGGKLVLLKDKHPEVYESKFEERFGKKPKA